MHPPSPKMLSELLSTLDAVGAGLDAMDRHEMPLDARGYQGLAAFCHRMLELVPKGHPGLVRVLQDRDSLSEIWHTIQLTHILEKDAPRTWIMQEAILAAKRPELFKGRPQERRKR